jgi:DNA mismatch repair protein MutS2
MSDLAQGNLVQILGSDKVGVVLSIWEKNKKAVVAFDKFEISVQLKNIKKLDSSNKILNQKYQPKSSININVERPSGSFISQSEVDFHGFLVQEALEYLDLWIDRALLAGQRSLTIIHGKGSGVLRAAIRQYLKKHKHIKITRAPMNAYDDGMTHVELV